MPDFKFEIVKSVGILSEATSGWTKELNFISWNGAEPKYDLREWAPGHTKMSKGITLTKDEAEKLMGLLLAEL